MMTNGELESKILNHMIPDNQIDDLVTECEEGLVLRSTAQAREVINRLVHMVKS